MDLLIILIQSFWIITPAYIANASALLTGGGRPIDGGKTWKDGRRILGDGKTWQGLIIGTLIGMTGGFALSTAAPIINSFLIDNDFSQLSITNFEGFPFMIPLVFSISTGALLGDSVESFLKRRANIQRGEDWIPFDQLDFIIGVLVSSFLMSSILSLANLTKTNWFTANLTLEHIIFLLIVSPFIHILSNLINKKIRKRQATKA